MNRENPESDKKKQKLSSVHARKELAEEHEQELKEKHVDKYTFSVQTIGRDVS